MKDYWNRVTAWLYDDEDRLTRIVKQGHKYVWRRDTAHSGQIPRVDVPLHTTYVMACSGGNIYVDAQTLSMMNW